LDEPTVGLEPLLRRDLWRMFRELAASGTTLPAPTRRVVDQ
jgi:ABC-2 type transport system ATP-binding protein